MHFGPAVGGQVLDLPFVCRLATIDLACRWLRKRLMVFAPR